MAEKEKTKLGLWTGTSLVVGSMVASGIFMLPASLASFGSLSLLGWLISGTGAICIALVFSWLSRILPVSRGGPYAYSRAGMGDFAGFWVAWGYWISIWCANAALSIACVSYLTTFFPIFSTSTIAAVMMGLSIIWFLTWLNSTGIRNAGYMQLITTILKLVPLVMIGIGGLFYLNTDHFTVFNRTESSVFAILGQTITLTFFAFLGLECATIPSSEIEHPEKNVPKATIIGASVSTLIYILTTIAVMGILPPDSLIQSDAPLADAAHQIWGNWARYLVSAGAIISTFGALNGWILMQAQIPAAVAEDHLLPAVFAKVNKSNTPYFGLIITSILTSALLITNYNQSLGSAYKYAILLSTLAILVPYLFSLISFFILGKKTEKLRWNKTMTVVTSVAFVFCVWAVIGSGAETVYWGFILFIAGLPLYAWVKMKKSE